MHRAVLDLCKEQLDTSISRRYYASYYRDANNNFGCSLNMTSDTLSVSGSRYANGTSDVEVSITVYYR